MTPPLNTLTSISFEPESWHQPVKVFPLKKAVSPFWTKREQGTQVRVSWAQERENLKKRRKQHILIAPYDAQGTYFPQGIRQIKKGMLQTNRISPPCFAQAGNAGKF